MKLEALGLPGVVRITLPCHRDGRGFFVERFNVRDFVAAGLPTGFVQDNHSRSEPGVLRGLHVQHEPPQGKLVGVIAGRVFDVMLDARPDSPMFGRHISCELDGEEPQLLWIPPGIAHGFCVMGDRPAHVVYKVDAFYNPRGERGIAYNDPALGIRWPVAKPLLSARDAAHGGWEAYCKAMGR